VSPNPARDKSFTESRGGFELNLKLTVKAFLAGYRIAEVPSTWRDRTSGQSRFRLFKWLPMCQVVRVGISAEGSETGNAGARHVGASAGWP